MLAVNLETADPALGVRSARCTYRKRRVGHRLSWGRSSRRRRLASNPGLYRYTAFGEEYPADATTPAPSISQPLQWKGRWGSSLAGGIYDVRARQWSPGMGAFLQVDGFERHDLRSTLWGWPRQNPGRFRDPSGRDGVICPGGEGCSDPGDGGLPPGGPPGPPGPPGPAPGCDPTTQCCPQSPIPLPDPSGCWYHYPPHTPERDTCCAGACYGTDNRCYWDCVTHL